MVGSFTGSSEESFRLLHRLSQRLCALIIVLKGVEEMHLSSGQPACLIRCAKQGDEDAFGKLWAAYEKAVEGYIRSRLWESQAADPDVAHDIAQNTWIMVKKKISVYDPSKAGFYTFVRYWANVMLLRYFKGEGLRSEIEILVYEFPELEEDNEVQGMVKGILDSPVYYTVTERKTYEILLEVTLREGGCPHQLIAFGFNKLVDDWKPQKIVEKLSGALLKPLEERLEEDYISESLLPADYVCQCFQPLREKMGKKVCSVIDANSRKFLEGREILANLVGGTILWNY